MKTPSALPLLPLSLWIDLRDFLTGKPIINTSLDHRGNLWMLAEQSGKVVAIEVSPDFTRAYNFTNAPENPVFVQPLPEDQLLLANSRSRYYGRDSYDLNGSIFSEGGTLLRHFLLGDGIEDVQTTRDGSIWTSYFEQGVFGSNGWGGSGVEAVGKSGLVQWDSHGHKQYEFQPPGGVETIFFCYALNVVSDREAWVYYYKPFVIVRIVDGQVADYWQCPVEGSHQFAVWRDYVALCGSYGNQSTCYLLELRSRHEMRLIASGQVFEQADWLRARGDAIMFSVDRLVYRFTVSDLLREWR